MEPMSPEEKKELKAKLDKLSEKLGKFLAKYESEKKPEARKPKPAKRLIPKKPAPKHRYGGMNRNQRKQLDALDK